MESSVGKLARLAAQKSNSFRELHGVVVSAGLMSKTVKVRVGGQRWDKFLKKSFNDPKTLMVRDPNDSLRTGDVIAIHGGQRWSKAVRHVVKHVIAPAQEPLAARAPVPTAHERWLDYFRQRGAKHERRALRAEVVAGENLLRKAGALAKSAEGALAAVQAHIRSREKGAAGDRDID